MWVQSRALPPHAWPFHVTLFVEVCTMRRKVGIIHSAMLLRLRTHTSSGDSGDTSQGHEGPGVPLTYDPHGLVVRDFVTIFAVKRLGVNTHTLIRDLTTGAGWETIMAGGDGLRERPTERTRVSRGTTFRTDSEADRGRGFGKRQAQLGRGCSGQSSGPWTTWASQDTVKAEMCRSLQPKTAFGGDTPSQRRGILSWEGKKRYSFSHVCKDKTL